MTGFDETVPPEPDPSSDATSVDEAAGADGAVKPEGGPEQTDADGEQPVMGGDDDLLSGHLGE